ncbi:hypothetical protein Q7P37_003666 [Cladosporium fusiforme]
MQGLTTGTTPRAASKAVILMAIGMTLLLAAHLCYNYPSLPNWKIPVMSSKGGKEATAQNTTTTTTTTTTDFVPDDLPCKKLKGGEDVLVVMRTGATEIQDKLPAHLNTTFQCYNDYIILSDYEEDFEGHHVHDLLTDVEDDIKSLHPDFELWRRLRDHGRESLDDSELSGAVSLETGTLGKTDNEGWRLDKWKFLPMAVRTLELHPEKKWYVFVEPDTYLIWSNLLDWLRHLDPSEPLYYGSEVQIDQDVFAHGGSSFVISRPALQRVADLYTQNPSEWHAATSAHWAGDCILGKALKETGTPLTWAWPMFQGGNPHTMDFGEDKADGRSLWCAPALSYHHLAPSEIQSLFDFEQAWLRGAQTSRARSGGSVISWRQSERMRMHHQDVFRQYVLPATAAERADWSNMSPDLRAGTHNSTLSECRAMCEEARGCVQYAHSVMGCSFSGEGKLGQAAEGVQAGWIQERVAEWADAHGVCEREVMSWTVT